MCASRGNKNAWCPEFAHGWYDAEYCHAGCPKCHPAEPAKAKKTSGAAALNWLWCPVQDHGWYEGITRDGFFRDCDKCPSESADATSEGKKTWDRRPAKPRQPPKRTWCPEFAHGWYDAAHAEPECPKCHPAEPAKVKKTSGAAALNWLWCPVQDHGWYEGITRDGFFRDCDKCGRESAAGASATAPS